MGFHSNRGVHPTSNSYAQALARYLQYNHRLGVDAPHSVFGSDEHCTPPFNSLMLDGVAQAQGFTRVDLAKIYSRLTTKPTDAQIVRWMSEDMVAIGAHIYTKVKDNFQEVHWGRREMYPSTLAQVKAMQKRADKQYRRAILRDVAAGRIGSSEAQNIAHDYFHSD